MKKKLIDELNRTEWVIIIAGVLAYSGLLIGSGLLFVTFMGGE